MSFILPDFLRLRLRHEASSYFGWGMGETANTLCGEALVFTSPEPLFLWTYY